MSAVVVAMPLNKLDDAQKDRELAAIAASQPHPLPPEEYFASLLSRSEAGELAAQVECVDRCEALACKLGLADTGHAAQQAAARQVLLREERQPGSVAKLARVAAYNRLAYEDVGNGVAILHPEMIRKSWQLASTWWPGEGGEYRDPMTMPSGDELQRRAAAGMFLLQLRSLPPEQQQAAWLGCVSHLELPAPDTPYAFRFPVRICANAWTLDASPRSIDESGRVVPRELAEQWRQDEKSRWNAIGAANAVPIRPPK